LADTADLYAAAAAVIERSAAAYVSGVPEDTADDGLFGPASVTWQVSTDLASPVAGWRSLLMLACIRSRWPVSISTAAGARIRRQAGRHLGICRHDHL
jgi:hypothetical protein